MLVFKNGEYRKAGSVFITEGSLRNMLTDSSDLLVFTAGSLFTVEGTKLIEVAISSHVMNTLFFFFHAV